EGPAAHRGLLHRERRAHAHAQGQAAGGGAAVPGPDRRAVRAARRGLTGRRQARRRRATHAPPALARGSSDGSSPSPLPSPATRSPGSTAAAAAATQAGSAPYPGPSATPRSDLALNGSTGAMTTLKPGAGPAPSGGFTPTRCTPSRAVATPCRPAAAPPTRATNPPGPSRPSNAATPAPSSRGGSWGMAGGPPSSATPSRTRYSAWHAGHPRRPAVTSRPAIASGRSTR